MSEGEWSRFITDKNTQRSCSKAFYLVLSTREHTNLRNGRFTSNHLSSLAHVELSTLSHILCLMPSESGTSSTMLRQTSAWVIYRRVLTTVQTKRLFCPDSYFTAEMTEHCKIIDEFFELNPKANYSPVNPTRLSEFISLADSNTHLRFTVTKSAYSRDL